jgi:DNA mismatch endonuclease (patch repair protein)
MLAQKTSSSLTRQTGTPTSKGHENVLSKSKRSEVMSRLRGSGNKDTELALAKLRRRYGITGWRRNQPVFGKPDFVFPKFKLAIFVDGCFWHGCPKHATHPKHNRAFWQRKLAANKTRNRVVTRTLRTQGWRVLRVWGHELAKKNEARLVRRIQRAVGG